MRHLKTQVLWLQEAVARRELTIVKVPRVENPADMGTKHLAQREVHECLRRAGCHITGGRSRMAFRVRTGDFSQATLRLRKQIENIVMNLRQIKNIVMD